MRSWSNNLRRSLRRSVLSWLWWSGMRSSSTDEDESRRFRIQGPSSSVSLLRCRSSMDCRSLSLRTAGRVQPFSMRMGGIRLSSRKVELVARFGNHRTVDVQVADAAHLAETLTRALEPAGVTVRTTDVGTLILGRAAPSLDPDSPTAGQHGALRLFMDVAVEHQSWWAESGKPAVAAALAQSSAE